MDIGKVAARVAAEAEARELAKAEAKGKLQEYLDELGIDAAKAASSGAICPLCGSGTGKHKSGAFHTDAAKGHTRWKCFSCNHSGDIFTLYAELNGLADGSGEVMRAVYEKYGIQYRKGGEVKDQTQKPSGRLSGEALKDRLSAFARSTPPPMTDEQKEAAAKAFRLELEEAQKNLGEPEAVAYLASRGITQELAYLYGLGYSAKWIHPKARKASGAKATPRLIIPTGSLRYTARDIRKAADIPAEELSSEYYHAKAKAKAYDTAEPELFNGEALEVAGSWDNERPLYVVEGEIDALSIIQAGGLAIGLGSTANARLLVDKVAELDKRLNEPLRDNDKRGTLNLDRWRPRMVIALDADESGEKAARTLSDELGKLGVEVIRENVAELYAGAKDANEALVADAGGFGSRLLFTFEDYDTRKAELANSADNVYRAENCAAVALDALLSERRACKEGIASGFPMLDMLLSGDEKSGDKGGLMEGLYIVGAPSSCGKTTYLLQLADSVAESGRDVLIFSLEMSRTELVAKSLSRLTYRLAGERFKLGGEEAKRIAKTNYGISKGARYAKYSKEENLLIDTAVEVYRKSIAPHIFIYEGAIGGTSISEITRRISEHKTKTGAAPLVIVDYLQMIAQPKGERLTDKQAVDKNILALKVASRDYHTPLICISSYNRESYLTESALSSFKDSGSIEYSADVVIALSYAEVKTAEKGKGEKEAKAALKEVGNRPERIVKLELLKNRNGGKGSLAYSFYAYFNTFREMTEAEAMAALRFSGK